MLEDQAVKERVARAESLLLELESLPDPKARSTAIRAVQALLDLYGEALSRIVSGVSEAGLLPRALTEDELISHLLLLHGLHPLDTETRVRQAIRNAQSQGGMQGGDIQLLKLEGDRVRLRLVAGRSGSFPPALRERVELEILAAAPEIAQIEVEGASEQPVTSSASFIPIGNLIEVNHDG